MVDPLQLFRTHEQDVLRRLVRHPAIRTSNTEVEFGLRALSSLTMTLDGQKVYAELFAQSAVPYHPKDRRAGYSEHDVRCLEGVKFCHVVSDDVMPPRLNGFVIPLEKLSPVQDEELREQLEEVLEMLRSEAQMDEDALARLNDLYMDRPRGHDNFFQRDTVN